MEDKKDIGALIKDKLSDAEVALEGKLWDRIEGSLDDRDRRKRNLLILWISGGAAAVLLFLLLLNASGNSEFDPEGSMIDEGQIMTQVDSILGASEENSEKTISYEQIESMLDSLETTNEPSEAITTTKPYETGNSPDKSGESSGGKKRKPFTEEGVTVKTVYHYYNSATKEVFETTDKQVIDSLIDNGNRETDSVQVIETRIPTMKKKDSLG